jgi:RNA polymerase primary sigma factor
MGERDPQDTRNADEAIWSLVEANLPLAARVAARFRAFAVSPDDLRAEGVLGLAEAALRYDPALGVQFATYAAFWVRKRIREAVVRDSSVVRVSKYQRDRLSRLRSAERDLRASNARAPTQAELADRCGLDVRAVDEALRGAPRRVSLDAPVGDDSTLRLVDTLPQSSVPDPHETVEQDSAIRLLRAHLDALPERERTILRMHFGLDGRAPRPLASIAERFGLSRERIHQIERAALGRLRRLMAGASDRAAL